MQTNYPLLWSFMLAASASAMAETIPISDFASNDLTQWQEHSFKDHTRYRITPLNGTPLLHARSDNSASGLFRRIRIDLTQTPYLNWQWRVDKTLGNIDEKSKPGDDYPARLYVIKEGGFMIWQTRAINYVWASGQPQGSDWPNAFSDRSWMVSLRQGEAEAGQLRAERRNIREDFQRYFGEDVRYIDVVAVMTDTDNSGGKAEAYYGPIYFSD